MVSAPRSGTPLISIHALREEGDQASNRASGLRWYFYPRPPRGGRPRVQVVAVSAVIISIHALREEGDTAAVIMPYVISKFLSTPSARRATGAMVAGWFQFDISIHALREEGDPRQRSAK